MSLARARKMIAALQISDAEREAILDQLMLVPEVHARAFNRRLYLQNVKGTDRDNAIRMAILHFKSSVENVDGLREAVRHPNQRIRQLAKEIRDNESPNPFANENPD